eukprot:688667-Prymnesium_polylepis.1
MLRRTATRQEADHEADRQRVRRLDECELAPAPFSLVNSSQGEGGALLPKRALSQTEPINEDDHDSRLALSPPVPKYRSSAPSRYVVCEASTNRAPSIHCGLNAAAT